MNTEEKQNKESGWVMSRLSSSLLFAALSIFFLTAVTKSVFAEEKKLSDVQLTDLDGDDVSLRKYRGKVTVLLFWASWCPTCVEELKNFELYYRSYKNDGLNVIAVGLDDTLERIKDFREKNKISFPIIHDSNNSAKKTFEISMLPTLIVIDRQGKITKIKDPENNNELERIMGARDWGSKEFKDNLLELIKK